MTFLSCHILSCPLIYFHRGIEYLSTVCRMATALHLALRLFVLSVTLQIYSWDYYFLFVFILPKILTTEINLVAIAIIDGDRHREVWAAKRSEVRRPTLYKWISYTPSLTSIAYVLLFSKFQVEHCRQLYCQNINSEVEDQSRPSLSSPVPFRTEREGHSLLSIKYRGGRGCTIRVSSLYH